MSDPKDTYPVEGEIGNDAMTLARVMAGEMRFNGTDPNEITAYDAWKYYIERITKATKDAGQQMSREFEAQVKLDSPLGKQFMEAWLYLQHKRKLVEMLQVGRPYQL